MAYQRFSKALLGFAPAFNSRSIVVPLPLMWPDERGDVVYGCRRAAAPVSSSRSTAPDRCAAQPSERRRTVGLAQWFTSAFWRSKVRARMRSPALMAATSGGSAARAVPAHRNNTATIATHHALCTENPWKTTPVTRCLGYMRRVAVISTCWNGFLEIG